jgi:WD40 repeat protein
VEAAVACVAFRSDSRILAYRVGDKRIALTDLTRSDGTEVVELPLTVAGGDPFRAGRPITLAWSPSEPLLAIGAVSATGKGTVLFWDTAAEAERARWEGDFDSDGIMLAFAADGRRLALGTGDGTIRCFQVAERRVILRLEGAQHDGIECLHWEGSDRLLSAGILNAFKAWEFSDSSLRSSLGALPDRITSFAFSPDGGRLAVRTPGPRPRAIVLERFAGKMLHTFDLPDSSGVLVFRGDGNVLGWASPTGVAVAWDLSEGREMARSKGTTQVDLSLFEPTFLEDGRLVTPAMEEKGLVILDLLSGEKKETKVTLSPGQLAESGIRRFALSGDGRLLIGLPREIDPVRQAIPLWEVSSGERSGELAPAEDDASGFVHATPSPDGRLLFKYCQPASFDASVESSELSLSVWDLRDKHRLWQAKCSTLVSAWAFSADGKLLAVGYQNGFVEIWDARAGEELFRWQPHGEREVRHLAFTPDGTDVACGDGGSPVRILHLAELKRQLAAMGLDW